MERFHDIYCNSIPPVNDLSYVALEKIKCSRPVNKLSFLKRMVLNKTVLDLGALDETAYKAKTNTGFWVHGVMSETAKKVIGIDSSEFLDAYKDGLKTSPNSIILKGDVFCLETFITPDIDIVVAGELIEHLNDAMSFLTKMKTYDCLKGKKLILTTPNACSMYNIILGIFGRESTHKDHVNIYSYKTLNTLCKKTSIGNWRIIPSYASYSEMILNSRGIKKVITIMFEGFTNILQYFFPLLCADWIIVIDL